MKDYQEIRVCWRKLPEINIVQNTIQVQQSIICIHTYEGCLKGLALISGHD